MTESGNPKDNAVAERVNNTIKNELLMGMQFSSKDEVRAAVDAALARAPASRQKAPGAVARAFLSENHPLDERGLVGVWNEGEGGEWLRDNQGGTLPRGY